MTNGAVFVPERSTGTREYLVDLRILADRHRIIIDGFPARLRQIFKVVFQTFNLLKSNNEL